MICISERQNFVAFRLLAHFASSDSKIKLSVEKMWPNRNHMRGHLALGGKPSITRLQEQD
jgi:hypothetical protein